MTSDGQLRYDDPAALAEQLTHGPRPLLIGLDVDGVLAPIVDHADDAELLDGIADAVATVASLPDVHVAVISGRSIADLTRFGFTPPVEIVGSHGMEAANRPMATLGDAEREVLGHLVLLATAAADAAGDGAWVEHKPASTVLHVRQADPTRGNAALDRLRIDAAGVHGATVKAGSGVLELFARSADKGTALAELRDRVSAAATVFVGDDLTDEDAFALLDDTDFAIKVGDADTVAAHRLADPAAVLQWLRALAM